MLGNARHLSSPLPATSAGFFSPVAFPETETRISRSVAFGVAPRRKLIRPPFLPSAR